MELRLFLSVLRRRWLSATAVMLAVLAAVAAFTFLTEQKYTATTSLFFAVEGTGSASELAQGSSFAESQMTSYAKVASSPIVLTPVIGQLGLGESPGQLALRTKVTVPTDTVTLEIAVTDENPQRAADIANAIGAQLSTTAAQLSPDRANGSEAVRATTLAPAERPTSASSPNIARNAALGLAASLLLGSAVALLRNGLDTKVRSELDVRALTDSSILGVIAFDDNLPKHPVILRDNPRSAAAEAIRRLRTNLQFIDIAERSRSIVISSSVPGEGKTTTAINLAVSLADAGSRVLLIDADLRRPSMAKYLGLEGQVGLTTVLIGKATIADVVQPYGESGLDILPAGQIPPNPSELLGSKAMGALLERATSTYDVVLIDSPPLLPVTDAAVLGRQAGGLLLVAGVDRIHRPQLKEALATLDAAGCRTVGVVVNKIARREVGSYVYDRGYYGSDSTSQPDEASALVEAEDPGEAETKARGEAEAETTSDHLTRA